MTHAARCGSTSEGVDPDGDDVSLTYDEFGDLETWTDGEDRTRTYSYDDLGALESIIPPSGAANTIDYDSEAASVGAQRVHTKMAQAVELGALVGRRGRR